MRVNFLLQRVALVAVITAAPLAAWSADSTKQTVGSAASAPKAKAAKKAQTATQDCPKGAGETTGSTGPSTKGETGTQGGTVLGPKKPKCPQDLAGKVAAPAAK
jgi:hypothetical protein